MNNPGHIDGKCRAQSGLWTFLSRMNLTHFKVLMLNIWIIVRRLNFILDPLASQTQLFIGLITKGTAHYLMLGILPQLDCTLSEVQVIIWQNKCHQVCTSPVDDPVDSERASVWFTRTLSPVTRWRIRRSDPAEISFPGWTLTVFIHLACSHWVNCIYDSYTC